jgi:3'-phosphoadenosine 5'-phosphosulfate sulfotransferase (PAPS reductase)/FAD synthetase
MIHFSKLQDLEVADTRHILGLSGGKDSAALAVYIKDQYPEIHDKVEYYFSDTGKELPEVYSFMDKLETYLEKKIVSLTAGQEFDHWLTVHNDLLPSARQRWCTRVMKIKPFEKYIGNDPIVSYVGIRADEMDREGFISTKPTINSVFPFREDGLKKADIFRLLENSVGIPEYYKWRTRSGCFFCFFQRQDEWLGLKENHPKLFEEAKAYESRHRERYNLEDAEVVKVGNGQYTWSQAGTLDEVVAKAEKKRAELGIIASSRDIAKARWQDILENEDDDPEDQACLMCSL